ncbi:uncharacterized protein LOC121858274 isoform X2 [Homarus americanus]|uniref:uncharacterized protein LOC121858274 isoform X2 n=1 Tax=Homarus americanus TaxID=6706 RepID=UPI001C48C56F|nr:uncharacterized protein LOC121858274 isoform X2 [Homarus americanus]
MTEMKSVMMSEGGGGECGSGQSDVRPITHQLWLRHRQDDDEDDDDEEGGVTRSERGVSVSEGGEVVVVGGGGATTLYSREDGATVLEAADGTTTVLRPHAHAATQRLTVTVEGGEGGVGGEGMTAIVDGQTGTATLVEGAEVVRTQAVSYATPILHHVFLQAAPATASTTHAYTTHTTLLHTTHTPTIQPSTATPRKVPPMLNTSATPIILHPNRTVKQENNSSSGGGGNSRLVEVVTGSTTSITTSTNTITTTSACVVGAGDLLLCHPQQTTSHPSTASQFLFPSSSPPPSLSPQSSSSSASSVLGSSSGPRTDDELTLLSWLQDSNLLRGTALSPVKLSQGVAGAATGEGSEVVKAESPTSDYGDETSDPLEPGELTLNDQPHTQPSRSQPIPYNPQVHVNAKPPYSFSCLIFMAIEDSTNKALPVKDIYAWILDHFPYFRNAPTGWKNSVRHNLSLNKCFRKVEKAPNLGKGSLWMVDPAYRPNLLQALSKTPFHPYSNLDRIYMVSTKAAYNNRQLGETVGNQGSVVRTAVNVETPVISPSKPAGANVPDPELFPYLARRLGSSTVGGLGTLGTTGVGTPAPGVHSEDVDAAAAMLALKHGSHIVTPASESYSQLRNGKDTSVLYEECRKRKRKRKHTAVGDARMMVISSSPSEDHSYTSVEGDDDYSASSTPLQATPNSTEPHSHPSPPKKVNHSPTSSVDEAFSDDSYDSDVTSEASQADMRQLVEGADALLNLAAVATSLASQRNFTGCSLPPTSPQHHQHRSSPNQRSHRPHNSSNSSRLGKVHILKPSPAKLSPSKSNHNSSKNKADLLHNNNTIINNNNKVLKVRRFCGAQGRGAHRHQLPTSR